MRALDDFYATIDCVLCKYSYFHDNGDWGCKKPACARDGRCDDGPAKT